MKIFARILVGLFAIIFLFGSGLTVGIYLGYENRPPVEKVLNVLGKESPPERETVDFSPFWETWNLVDEKFVVATSTATSTTAKIPTEQDKVYGAISGLVASLGDPYSVFLPPVEKKIFEEEISGHFGGIGIEVDVVEGGLTVISPLEDTPAKRAGLEPNDRIIKIDDTSTEGLGLDDAVNIIRGEVGTEVKLTVRRPGESKPLEFKIIRDVIQVPTIKTESLKNGVFVIRLYSFSATSPGLFRKALKEFALAKTDRLLLDLRGNPGGYLESAVDIASWFLREGEVVVTEDHGTSKETRVYKSKGYKGLSDKVKLVVLVDGGSASASEILAGALAEHGRAVLVGKKTFGKGSVQELVPVTDDASVKLTIARWLTPLGHSLSQNGLVPEHVIEPAEGDKRGEKDAQQDKAVEVLLEMK